MMSIFPRKLRSATFVTDHLNGACHTSTWKPEGTERILILAPHPDDECLSAGGIIASMQQYRPESEIRVVIATNGDASYTTVLFHGSHLPSHKYVFGDFRIKACYDFGEGIGDFGRLTVHPQPVFIVPSKPSIARHFNTTAETCCG
jgi:hypothetical protein